MLMFILICMALNAISKWFDNLIESFIATYLNEVQIYYLATKLVNLNKKFLFLDIIYQHLSVFDC